VQNGDSFSGAELSNIVNLAALKAVSTGKTAVNETLLEEAYDDTLMGAERKSYLLTEEGKRKTAYHEAGHALCSYYLFGVSSIRKVTIVPRGQALGLVARIRTNDDERIDNEEIVSGIVVALGGRVGEMVFTGNDDVTTGASNDFEVATQQAKALLLYLGTNEKIGPVVNSEHNESSPKQKHEVDQELFTLIHVRIPPL
jgi:ATP-dependent Zn protease